VRRGERVERSFAQCLETGAMRRVHLRGHENVAKRYLVHVAAFNLGLLMRRVLGVGTPRELANRIAKAPAGLLGGLSALVARLVTPISRVSTAGARCSITHQPHIRCSSWPH